MRLLLVTALAGCLGPATRVCGDGTTCTDSQVCAPAGGCIDPDQLSACEGLVENANCTAAAAQLGVCQSGVCEETQWNPTVAIGGNVAATAISQQSSGIAVDRNGNAYIADGRNNRILRVDASGVVTTVAGTGVVGFGGDGGLATTAQIFSPEGVAVDGLGNVFIADTGNNCLRRVDTSGIITTIEGICGSPTPGPQGVAVDGLGDVYFIEAGLLRLDPTGLVTGNRSMLSQPAGVAADDRGHVYVADTNANRIVEFDFNQSGDPGVTTVVNVMQVAGDGGDDGPATDAQLTRPSGIAVDAAGNLFIADTLNDRIRKVDTHGIITNVAGGGLAGDGGLATDAELQQPSGIAVDALGRLYIAEPTKFRVRLVDTAGIITTLAGDGGFGSSDGGAATSMAILDPRGGVFDPSGNLYVADRVSGRILRVDSSGLVTTVAGTGIAGFAGDGGAALAAQLAPFDVALDAAGNLYVADNVNGRIRRIDTNGIITTVAGGGTQPFTLDNIPATSAQLQDPRSIAIDGAGNLYIADSGHNVIRRVAGDGTIATVAGNGLVGFSGDGPATEVSLTVPQGIALDASGNLYIADTSNERIRRVDATGMMTTVAGSGLAGFDGDGDATAVSLQTPTSVAVAASGDLYVAEGSLRIRRVNLAAQTIATVAGDGRNVDDGDGGAASAASLSNPNHVIVNALGDVFVSEPTSNLLTGRIRRIDTAGVITTVVGAVEPAGMGPLGRAKLADPRAFVVTPALTLVAGGNSGIVQAVDPAKGWLEVVAGRYPQSTAVGARARFRDHNFGAVVGLAYDGGQLVFLTESNRIDVVTMVDPADPDSWTIATLAGAGAAGFLDGATQTAAFRGPTGLAYASGTLYVADTGNHAIRAIDLTTDVVTTIAGTPATFGFAGDGGPAVLAALFSPQGIAMCNGDLFVADTGNHRVRRIAGGTITSVIGTGVAASSGEGHPSSTFPIDAPQGLACDAVGNLFVTSSSAVRMLLADTGGAVDGSGTVRTIYGLFPRTIFPSSVTRCLSGLAVIDPTTVRVTDSCTGLMVELVRSPAP